jgi:thiol-disulfide isomerase/thioredoxin
MKKIILYLLYLLLPLFSSGQQKFAYLTCRLHSLKDQDTLTLVTDQYGRPYFPGTQREYTQVIRKGMARFKIPVGEALPRFNLRFRGHQDLQYLHGFLELGGGGTYYLEAGDDIVLTEQKAALSFSGKGAAKYQVREAFEKIDDETYVPVNKDSKKEDYQRFFLRQDSGYRVKRRMLAESGGTLSPAMMLLFKADLVGSYLDLRSLKKLVPGLKMGVVYNTPLFKMVMADTILLNHRDLSAYSPFYGGGLISQYRFLNYFCRDKPFDLAAAYGYFKSHYAGTLRDRLVTDLIYQYKKSTEDLAAMAEDALAYVWTAGLRNALSVIIANHKIGRPAYDFALADTNGKIHRLSDFKGKVVLLDYWYNGCGGCRKVAPYIAEVEKLFAGKPVEFISITFQNGDRWKKGIQSGDYMSAGVLNLSTGRGVTDEHPALTAFNVTEYPTLIMIDRNGNLLRNPEDPVADRGKDLAGLIREELDK